MINSVHPKFTADEGASVLQPEDWRKEGFTFPKTEEERCTDPNCFSHAFKYSASSDQLKARNNHTMRQIHDGNIKHFLFRR